ncbi:hypothetical protein PITC_054860 [Penicillium italicum]|uniref:Rhodopsin domain-containing protein n=1 Tax=Penicillium italicum TaxID=40296 RepID=A0A0A2KHL8_PENIT|nr:hypothetical protein PITC_054860 [Penicillium italicum]
MVVTFPIETPAQRQVLGVAITFSILAVVAVSLRLLAHHLANKKWILSDYFIIAAGIFAVGLQSISITGVIQAGIGYDHVTAIAGTYGMGPITKLLQLIIPLQFLWVLSLSFTWAVRVWWITMGVIIAWTIGTILAGCLICRPFAFNWDQTIPGGSCGNQVTSFTVTGVINLLTDVVVLVTPMPLLYKLQMARYKKVTFITIFGLGGFTCIISILRISVLSTMDFTDITYTLPRANIFSGLEPCLAVILASVPMMRPLLGRSIYTPEMTARPSNKYISPSGRSRSTGDGEFQPLQDDSTELCLRPLGPKHEVGITVQKPSETRERYGGSEDSPKAGESRDIGQMQKEGLEISTIPWVTDAPDYFQGYGGKAIGAKDATTTYGINCLSDQTACHRFTPDLTVIYGPSTYDMIANGYKFDFTSGCTLMGSPTPTGASCTETKSLHETSTITSATVLVPATGDDSTLGIFPATLIVTDTGDFSASTATETETSINFHVSTSDASWTMPATATADPITAVSVGFLNSTATITGVPTYFGNGTSRADKNGTTTAVATVTVPMAMKNHGIKMATPMVMVWGFVASAMFWI